MRLKVTFLLLLLVVPLAFAKLRVGFYGPTCPNAESIVQAAVRRRFNLDKSITAALLRMHFHDCFVRGCDASILIDSTRKKPSEKDAGPNLTQPETPYSSREDHFISSQRDDEMGLVSNPDEVNLPIPTLSVSQAFQSFRAKNLTMDDMVTLLGAHTVGVAHCSFFLDRIIRSDPTMDPNLRKKLNDICGAANGSNPDPTAFLDQGTPLTVDNEFFKQIGSRRGVMQIDQALANDPLSRGIVSGFTANTSLFRTRFAEAMVKMGEIQVLEGAAGEIRRNCRVFNPTRRGRARGF
ncbi:Cycling DOF factor 2, putative isoform 1 [Hibiscus syriacus]|uniref:Peroxidase n=1 Tax=Hibiscus syriacus TaxID=106335 RepID=A0A6A3A7Z4_HIBSY|nr:Cycling DOF factor 2, putative isoform 1 [Hibiscus syriacus]